MKNTTTDQKKIHFKDGEIAIVKLLNTHNFELGEEIRILGIDDKATVSGYGSGTVIYKAESINNPENWWWVAEPEIKKKNEPETTTPQDSSIGVLQDKWEVKPFTTVTGRKYSIVSSYDILCKTDKKEDAELICKAVNERQKLLDSNRELLDENTRLKEIIENMAGVGSLPELDKIYHNYKK